MRLFKLALPSCFILVLLGSTFTNIHAHQVPVNEGTTVKIGLLIPDKNSLAAMHGAEMAILKANEKGGYNGKPFQLVVRSMEGPWGTGSKQAVDLIFEEKVCALMGSSDGRNGHLIEQVSTKARIVFLSSWASDPTLAQAFVPWFFTCVPTDIQQADALIKEIYDKRKIAGIALVSDNGYDSKLAVESFTKRTKLAGKPDPVKLFYDDLNQKFNTIIDQINNAEIKGIVLFGKPSASLRLIQLLKEKKINKPLFGTLSLLDEEDHYDNYLKYFEAMVLVSSGNSMGLKSLTFRNEFQKIYGKAPGAVSEYSFDGMSLLIEAIRSGGPDRENIQNALTKVHFEGVTGPIQFDDKGKRIGKVNLVEIKSGVPVEIGRK
jgi:branched-chain amino acid transport system substrate-binding protein